VEEAAVALAVAGYLLHQRRHFRIRADRRAWLPGLAPVVALASGVVAVSAALAELAGARQPVASVLAATTERLVGAQNLPLRGGLGGALGGALLPVGIVLAGLAGLVVVRPPRKVSRGSVRGGSTSSRRAGRHPALAGPLSLPLERARGIVARHGADTLAYFALRDDKEQFFWGDSLVAYAIHHGVCLVSPDPVGPADERTEVWQAFRRFADAHGWVVAVVGASAQWLPLYRAGGLHDRYIGDEGVVDVRRFRLEGKRNKALRQAVNRVARNGYTVEFHDPATISVELADELRDLMAESRRGDGERGFSMTLSRLFDPDDRGLLLAVARTADGLPAAFCQFVPASAINGWSLDVMRRSLGEHPNGLVDFLVVQTIRHVEATGGTGLGLNFATLRAVLAGESGSRIERRLLEQLSDSMQIESLWRFNAKFHPDWHPRYLVVDAAEHLPAAGAALARAESLWDLPVLGRLLRRGVREPAALR
jgi:lysyl-tRNA synthetase class 2